MAMNLAARCAPLVSIVAVSLVAVSLAGCGDLASGPVQANGKSTPPAASPAPPVPPPPAAPRADRAGVKPVKPQPQRKAASVDARRGGPPRTVGHAEALAVKRISQVIRESVELGPTLVVWLLDRTASAQEMVRDVSEAAQEFYEAPETLELATAESQPLLTAIVAFDDEPQFIIDPPTGEPAQAVAGFNALQPSAASRERPFTAIKSVLEKYGPLRMTARREIVLVLVTDEAGDDPRVVDELIDPLRRQAISLYAIGLAAPWGQQNPFATNPKAVEAKDDSVPVVGPESCLSERVDIENWAAQNANRETTALIESGFGPFALERLCRATRGKFFILRPELGYGYRAISALTWPPGGEMRFDEMVVGKYAPDYVSEAEYRKLLAENKARAALCEAARLPKAILDGSPGTRFPKEIEAKMAKKLSAAQQFAARNLPLVDRLYEVLSPGEADRAKLTSPRWQAQFDLALGQVLANKARLDGYNSMIAALKRGKNFQKPDSKAWLLEPADSFETESTIRKLAEKAKLYLERVIAEHAGTPWAKIAEEELKTPLGWAWKEV